MSENRNEPCGTNKYPAVYCRNVVVKHMNVTFCAFSPNQLEINEVQSKRNYTNHPNIKFA